VSLWVDRLETTLSASSAGVTEVEGGRSVRYPDLLRSSQRWDGLLAGPDRAFVSVVLPNAIEYLEVYLACLRTGSVFNPIPYFTSTGELKRILGYVKPRLVVTDRADVASTFAPDYRVVSPADAASGARRSRQSGEGDVACLYYSSGTTASPKGVLYSHGNIYSLIDSIHRDFRFTEGTRQLALLPFGHTASINYNILPALFSGSPLFVSQGFQHLRANFFEVLARHRINYTEIVPSVLLMLVNLRHQVEGLDLSALEFIGCGSSTLPIESQKRFMELYGVRVANLYGLSETGPSHIDDPREPGWEPGSIGRPLGVNRCRISLNGEILLAGENVFVGYHENRALYEKVVRDGWFQTGDLGFERDGRFFFSDRKKDLIIKSGINIAPAEIEEVIYQCPSVLECAVVAVPDRVHGETVAAAVVPRDGVSAEALTRQILDHCKANLSPYKVPSVIKVVDQIPKTHSGKLLRRKVREQLAQ
jgi:long-chain acyl-CoA synthetase